LDKLIEREKPKPSGDAFCFSLFITLAICSFYDSCDQGFILKNNEWYPMGSKVVGENYVDILFLLPQVPIGL